MKRIALLACGLAAAATFATPANAVYPLCQTDVALEECLHHLLSSDAEEICVPSGDLEDDCRLGG